MENLTYNRQRILFQDGNIYTVGRGVMTPHKKNHVAKIDVHGKLWCVNIANGFCYNHA